MQKKINDTIDKNKELYEINPPVSTCTHHVYFKALYLFYLIHIFLNFPHCIGGCRRDHWFADP